MGAVDLSRAEEAQLLNIKRVPLKLLFPSYRQYPSPPDIPEAVLRAQEQESMPVSGAVNMLWVAGRCNQAGRDHRKNRGFTTLRGEVPFAGPPKAL